LVGESGSGKTTLARALVGLGESVAGSVEDASGAWPIDTGERSRELRRRFQYVFQNPYRALNPRQTIRAILVAAIRHFFPVGQAEAARRAAKALARVSLPADVLDRRPSDLSGGERQRVAIARALVCEPEVLICDEITSALDVSVQAAIIALLQSLQDEGVTILFVTHDLAVVRAIADRVIVLRAGGIVEHGPASEVLDRPRHAYTIKLLADSPRLERDRARAAQLVPA
jgi:peptide/nickel transport system ATP-binding protein